MDTSRGIILLELNSLKNSNKYWNSSVRNKTSKGSDDLILLLRTSIKLPMVYFFLIHFPMRKTINSV